MVVKEKEYENDEVQSQNEEIIMNFCWSHYVGWPISNYDKKNHLVETGRINKNLPEEVHQANVKRGEMISREDQNDIVLLKWKDTRDAMLLSTKHSSVIVPFRSQISQGQSSTNND